MTVEESLFLFYTEGDENQRVHVIAYKFFFNNQHFPLSAFMIDTIAGVRAESDACIQQHRSIPRRRNQVSFFATRVLLTTSKQSFWFNHFSRSLFFFLDISHMAVNRTSHTPSFGFHIAVLDSLSCQALTHSVIHSPTHTLTHSLTHPPTHPPTHSLTHSLTHLLTYLRSHLLTTPLTHSSTH